MPPTPMWKMRSLLFLLAKTRMLKDGIAETAPKAAAVFRKPRREKAPFWGELAGEFMGRNLVC